jgi:Family of unknown function (DUF5923)
MAKRAREDPEYRASLDTLFNVAHKWLKGTGNAAATVAQTTSLESFVKDPTPERHLINAIRYINELVQNISGGKSPEDLYSALRNCAIDIRNDSDLRRWVEDYLAYARRALADVGDNLEEIGSTRQDLRRRWNELTDTDSNKSRKLKEDFVALQKEVREFQERMEQDKDLTAIRKAHSQLGHDIEETVVDIAAVGLQAAISDTSWVWTDLFNVYLPRFVRMLKSIPIPRYGFFPHVSLLSLMYVTVLSMLTRRSSLCSKTLIFLLSDFFQDMFSSATSRTLRLLRLITQNPRQRSER